MTKQESMDFIEALCCYFEQNQSSLKYYWYCGAKEYADGNSSFPQPSKESDLNMAIMRISCALECYLRNTPQECCPHKEEHFKIQDMDHFYSIITRVENSPISKAFVQKSAIQDIVPDPGKDYRVGWAQRPSQADIHRAIQFKAAQLLSVINQGVGVGTVRKIIDRRNIELRSILDINRYKNKNLNQFGYGYGLNQCVLFHAIAGILNCADKQSLNNCFERLGFISVAIIMDGLTDTDQTGYEKKLPRTQFEKQTLREILRNRDFIQANIFNNKDEIRSLIAQILDKEYKPCFFSLDLKAEDNVDQH